MYGIEDDPFFISLQIRLWSDLGRGVERLIMKEEPYEIHPGFINSVAMLRVNENNHKSPKIKSLGSRKGPGGPSL